jgi:hypothetical protein
MRARSTDDKTTDGEADASAYRRDAKRPAAAKPRDGDGFTPSPALPYQTCPRHRPIHVTFGPAGEASNEAAGFDATAEWLAHVEAGRIG